MLRGLQLAADEALAAELGTEQNPGMAGAVADEPSGNHDAERSMFSLSLGLVETMSTLTEFANAGWHGLHRPIGRTEQMINDFLVAASEAGAALEVERFRGSFDPIFTNSAFRTTLQRYWDGELAGDLVLPSDDPSTPRSRPQETVGTMFASVVAMSSHDFRARFLLQRLLSRRNPDEMIFGSLLMVAVAQFEQFIRGIVRLYFEQETGRTASTTFTLAQLRAEGAAELHSAAIDAAVDALMSDFKTWQTWLAKAEQVGCRPETLSFDPPAFVEIFARRNAHAHSAGRANGQYLRSMVSMPRPTVGTFLPVTLDYIRLACEQFVCVGLRVLALTAKRLALISNGVIAVVIELPLLEDLPRLGFWHCIPELAKTMNSMTYPMAQKHEARLYAAWARRELGEDIEQELRTWDVDSLDIRLQLARVLILRDVAEAHRLWRVAVDRGVYSPRDIHRVAILDAHAALLRSDA
jgi:hypothetical protein